MVVNEWVNLVEAGGMSARLAKMHVRAEKNGDIDPGRRYRNEDQDRSTIGNV